MSLVLNGSGTITGATTLASTVTSPTLTTPVITSTLGVGGATPSASGAGITFPATQSASTDANTLDDYEEGTFTPTIEFGGGSTGLAYTMQNGYYTKIGRTVTVTGILYLNSKGSSTGIAVMRGLPFANANLTNNYSGIIPYTELISFAGVPELTLVPNSTNMGVYQTDTTGANSALSSSNFASTLAQIRFNFVYQTAT